MKPRIILPILLLLILCGVSSISAQRTRLPKTSLPNIIITMKQEISQGWGSGDVSPYIITIYDNGTITYEGIDEYGYIYDAKQQPLATKEIPEKIIKKHKITKTQFLDLLNEFYKIKFFSLKDTYSSRDNGDGTKTIIADGGLATVVTSINVNGRTKSIKNINFAPEELIELQRKIYKISNIASYTKRPAYWLTKFPNELFPPSPPRDRYRKVARMPPTAETSHQIDLNKRWGFFTPCVTTKAKVESLLGSSITEDKSSPTQTYQLASERMSVMYSPETGNWKLCNNNPKIDTVVDVSVYEIKDIYLSELNVDLTKFKTENFEPAGTWYYNKEEGITIETRTVEFSNKSYGKLVTNIQFTQNFKGN